MILNRYLLKEHFGPFVFSILMLMFVFLLNIVFRDLGRILSRGIDFLTILEYLFLNLAWIIALAVPMGVLIATLSTFGRLSADNEITAIKASGISFYKLLLPLFAASIILAAAMIVYNNEVLPYFNHKARLLLEDIFRKRPTLKFEPNVKFTDIPDMSLLTKTIIEYEDSSKLEQIFIEDLSDKEIRRSIFARWGILKFDKTADKLSLDLYDGEIHEMNKDDFKKYTRVKFERHRFNIEIPGLSLKRSKSEYRGEREKSVTMMKQDIENHKASIQQRKKHISDLIQRYMRETFDLELLKKVSVDRKEDAVFTTLEPTQRQIRSIKSKLENIQNQISMEKRIIKGYNTSIDKLRVEIHKKYSIPVACIVFVLIGAPLGILTRKGNMFVAAAVSFFFYLLYWVFLIAGEELGDRQLISPVLGMWAPNIIVGIFAVYLVLLTVREYRPIQWNRLKAKFLRKSSHHE